MRTLRARQVSTNKWCQRIDTGAKGTDVFLAECASQFGISAGDLEVVETEWTETQRQTAVTEQAAGTHDGLTVIAPPPSPPPPPNPDDILATAIAAATTLQELKDALVGRVAAGRVKGRPV